MNEKLEKVIALARAGVGGEKANALKIVKRICAEQGLDFDDVMQATDYREYILEIPIKNQLESDIVAQVCFKFALTTEHKSLRYNKRAKVFFYTTTPGKHVETVNAAQAYLRAFRKEFARMKKEFVEAFVYRHHIYGSFKANEEPKERKPVTAESLAEAERMMVLAKGMSDVKIHKQIGGGN